MSAMTKRSGRVQKGVRRAFLIEPCREWTTRDLLSWTHPRGVGRPLRDRRNYCRAVRRVADELGERVGRRWPEGVTWRARRP
jgi:hypothetical protein